MKELLERAVANYTSHSDVFERLGPVGYTIALNVRNVTPELYYSTFPSKWVERYTKQSFTLADPVVDFMFMGSGATRWSDIKHSRGPEKTALFLEIAAAEGLKFGGAVVLRSQKDPTVRSLVSVCRGDRELTDKELSDLEISFQQLLMKLEFGEKLTSRQLKILTLMASGATRQECANSVSVSPETVKKDVEVARKCLGARNATEAVAIAAARKLIAVSNAQVW